MVRHTSPIRHPFRLFSHRGCAGSPSRCRNGHAGVPQNPSLATLHLSLSLSLSLWLALSLSRARSLSVCLCSVQRESIFLRRRPALSARCQDSWELSQKNSSRSENRRCPPPRSLPRSLPCFLFRIPSVGCFSRDVSRRFSPFRCTRPRSREFYRLLGVIKVRFSVAGNFRVGS